jgi:hypothetical protein
LVKQRNYFIGMLPEVRQRLSIVMVVRIEEYQGKHSVAIDIFVMDLIFCL